MLSYETVRFREHIKYLLRGCDSVLRTLLPIASYLHTTSKTFFAKIVYYLGLDRVSASRIQQIQNTSCRFINNIKKNDHISPVLKRMKWVNMEKQFHYLQLNPICRLIEKIDPSIFLKNFSIHTQMNLQCY